ncbi:tRNA nucleotidyltransferase [Taphrina deformans PYCC 5710]|uniref:tRNA nucleotidyltransferase n=1 Tax=Taphrina deformans (strain PYCC 5710 / ATCC 11124 / CBS 356.35 / IMI 108563 / JCM 9778 / NBRC 8474) TaxID=1097556 RepID=R5A1Q4_TAPDE|nr:tRNA nucleotidyltransferase [Taphrina deformans PYCC 5710]|eukprot:CCX35437.1 tRNA nucleotidyltransferase [Taphrina deformans PYCC 5710]
MVRDHLKLTSLLEALVRATFPPRQVPVTNESSPLELGKFVRLLRKDWKLAVFVAFVADEPGPRDVDSLVALFDRIADLGLDRAWSFASFIDGKKIRPLLEKHETNIKVMKELVELVIEYRIEDPAVTEEEAMTKLRAHLETRPVGPEGW